MAAYNLQQFCQVGVVDLWDLQRPWFGQCPAHSGGKLVVWSKDIEKSFAQHRSVAGHIAQVEGTRAQQKQLKREGGV
ncbi:MAG: hypothetical protein ABIL62_08545 [Planctomycetota bacterium]